MKTIALLILALVCFLQGKCQNNWGLSMTGYDQTYIPTDFVTASNGDVYVSGVKYDNGISGFVNKLYKSTDQGASWAEISTTGLSNLGNVQALAISGNTMILGGTDVVSANGAKIFTSSNNGASWGLSMTGYDQTYIPADFVTASNGDVYVSGVKYDNGISGFVNKLYKSTDQGASWAEISTTGLSNLGNVQALAISGSTMILGGTDVNSANEAKIFTSIFSIANGIAEAELKKAVNVFPNPFCDIITIDFITEKPKSVKLISMVGETVKQIFVSNNSLVQLETNELQSGLYLIVAEYNSETKIFRVLKK